MSSLATFLRGNKRKTRSRLAAAGGLELKANARNRHPSRPGLNDDRRKPIPSASAVEHIQPALHRALRAHVDHGLMRRQKCTYRHFTRGDGPSTNLHFSRDGRSPQLGRCFRPAHTVDNFVGLIRTRRGRPHTSRGCSEPGHTWNHRAQDIQPQRSEVFAEVAAVAGYVVSIDVVQGRSR